MNGGKRPGAGRKPGALTRKNREIAEKAAAQGITPLEVLLEHMRWAHDKAVALRAAPEENNALEAINAAAVAVSAAEKAAPYMHAKLAAVQHSGDKDNPVSIKVYTGVPSV